MHLEKYTLLITVGRHTIVLIERASTDDERTLALKIDGRVGGDVHLLTCYLPHVALGPSDVAISGGTRLYLTPIDGGSITRFDLDDEIHAMYALDHCWLLVCETSVAMFDPRKSDVPPRYLHDDILLDSWWSDGRLIVEDLQGRQLSFRPSTDGAVPEPLVVRR